MGNPRTATLTFLGAAGTVTGSKYLLTVDDRRVLVDAGMFQGEKRWRLKNREPFPVNPSTIDDILITHAHADHTSYLPALVKHGFEGRIWCTEPTAALTEIVLRGVFTLKDSKRKGEENQLMFHWKYFDEANQYVNGQVGWYMVRLDNADHATRVARSIDALSENSDRETKTQTEQAFNQSFAKQFADIGLIVTAIMAAVFFTLLLLTGNTMAQAVRERIPELAVLKTIGFSNRSILWLVLAEAILLVALGGLIGLGIAALIMPAVSAASGGMIQLPGVMPETWLMGLLLMLAIGVIVGLLPALRGMRLNIVDALAGR